MSWWGQVVLAAVLAWLILWIEHWFPWQLLLKRELPVIARYILGCLAFLLPLTALFGGVFGSTPEVGILYLAALWVVVLASGLAVISAYGVDLLMTRFAQVGELREILRHYQERIDEKTWTRQADEEEGRRKR